MLHWANSAGWQPSHCLDRTAQLAKPVKQSLLFNTLAQIFAAETREKEAAETHRLGNAEKVTVSPSLPVTPALLPLRILLVEDNLFNQKLASHLLRRLSYTADLAANRLEALQAVEGSEYDVILMDVQMPEMDGLEATRCIHARAGSECGPCIIAMTANAMQGDLETCLAAGMNDYLASCARAGERLSSASNCSNDIRSNLSGV